MEDGDKLLDPFTSRDADLDQALDLTSSRLPSEPPSRPTKFQPKPKGKIKAEPVSGTDSLPPLPPVPIKKQEDVIMAKADEPSQAPSTSLTKSSEEVPNVCSPMDLDVGEDVVVREIDVFFTPSPLDENTQLYVMQYPLRPSWRPYELNEKCEEVRLKPKQSKIEVDVTMNAEGVNYEHEVAEALKLQKETLSSSKVPLITGYAVGILIGNQLHLNPVHSVVQLRPSLEHIDGGGMQKSKNIARSLEVSTKSDEDNLGESSKASMKQGKLVTEASNENIDDSEPWVLLEYHATDSPSSSRYQQKMVAGENSHIHFAMSLYDYTNSLCPGTSTDKEVAKGPSRRILRSMPLEERLKTWFSEGPQVHRFDALMHLAPTDLIEDVLKVLQRHADLVQGLWVSKSSLLYEGVEALARDYILFLFSKNHVIPSDHLKEIKLPPVILMRILSPLAVKRPALNDWKFREPKDLSFEKRYPDIVKEQTCAWSSREKLVMDCLRGVGKSVSANIKNPVKVIMPNRATPSSKVDPGSNRGKDGAVNSATITMSNETREALPKALLELFRNYKVCSLNLICQGLRDMAVSKSSLPKADSRTFIDAAHGASAPLPELISVISQVAVNIHGVYALRPTGNTPLDQLRDVVINLFRAKEPNAKLKRADILEAAKISLKRDITNSEYIQVVQELCISNKGTWVLKSGDGKPK